MMNLIFTGNIDPVALQQELITAIGPTGWYLNGSAGSITFVSTIDYPVLISPEVQAVAAVIAKAAVPGTPEVLAKPEVLADPNATPPVPYQAAIPYQAATQGTPAVVGVPAVAYQAAVYGLDPSVVINSHISNALDRIKINQINLISADCSEAIFDGFTSNALGAVYTYPAKTTDQMNLSASVLASLYPGLPVDWVTPFWCADVNGVWAFVNHTAAQIQTVGVAAKTTILTLMARNTALATKVMDPTTDTTDKVQAITW
jgi:hypothetical protein